MIGITNRVPIHHERPARLKGSSSSRSICRDKGADCSFKRLLLRLLRIRELVCGKGSLTSAILKQGMNASRECAGRSVRDYRKDVGKVNKDE